MIKRFYFILILILGLQPFLQAQRDSLDLQSGKILKLDFQANKIEVDGEGNILLLSTKKRQVYKLLSQFQFDSMISIGGASARDESLFHPIDLRSNTRQRIYVLDDVGQKVVLLSINLKVLQTFDFALVNSERDEGSDIFPIGFDLSPMGELFVLNQWDNTILRFSNQLNPNGAFGGTNFGAGSLLKPLFLEISTDQEVFVWDARKKQVMVYSLYGVFEYAIPMEEVENCDRMRIVGKYLILLNGNKLILHHLPTQKSSTVKLDGLSGIRDFSANRQHFYFLTEKGIYISPRSD